MYKLATQESQESPLHTHIDACIKEQRTIFPVNAKSHPIKHISGNVNAGKGDASYRRNVKYLAVQDLLVLTARGRGEGSTNQPASQPTSQICLSFSAVYTRLGALSGPSF